MSSADSRQQASTLLHLGPGLSLLRLLFSTPLPCAGTAASFVYLKKAVTAAVDAALSPPKQADPWDGESEAPAASQPWQLTLGAWMKLFR